MTKYKCNPYNIRNICHVIVILINHHRLTFFFTDTFPSIRLYNNTFSTNQSQVTIQHSPVSRYATFVLLCRYSLLFIWAPIDSSEYNWWKHFQLVHVYTDSSLLNQNTVFYLSAPYQYTPSYLYLGPHCLCSVFGDTEHLLSSASQSICQETPLGNDSLQMSWLWGCRTLAMSKWITLCNTWHQVFVCQAAIVGTECCPLPMTRGGPRWWLMETQALGSCSPKQSVTSLAVCTFLGTVLPDGTISPK